MLQGKHTFRLTGTDVLTAGLKNDSNLFGIGKKEEREIEQGGKKQKSLSSFP